MSKDTPEYRVCQWVAAAEQRFKNMDLAGIDRNGYPAIQKAIKHLQETGQLTVGQAQYIWNRGDPRGAYPKYNKHLGFDKKYGSLININLNDLIDSNLVAWPTGRSCIQPNFAKALADDTDWHWSMNTLRRKPLKPVTGLFE
jgi:hypothetical protein